MIETLAQGSLEFNHIYQELNYPKSGVLSGYFNDLINAGFITRDFTWLLKSRKESRLSHFRLSDNYWRFYLKYVAPNRQKIAREEFKEVVQGMMNKNKRDGSQFDYYTYKNLVNIPETYKKE